MNHDSHTDFLRLLLATAECDHVLAQRIALQGDSVALALTATSKLVAVLTAGNQDELDEMQADLREEIARGEIS